MHVEKGVVVPRKHTSGLKRCVSVRPIVIDQGVRPSCDGPGVSQRWS